MKKILLLILLAFCSQISNAQTKIKEYEYWFDNDYGNKVTTSITPINNFHLNTNIPTNSLVTGLHIIHFRFKDENSKYSSVISQFFYKQNAIITSPTTLLTNYEYWFDNNYAGKTVINFVGTNSNESIINAITTGTLVTGLHTFHIRFKDDNGKWSSTLSQFFYKQNTIITSPTTLLTKYEYWFDNNYAGKTTTNFAGTNSSENIINAISTNALVTGLHTFHIRFKDDNGKWSSTLSQFFYKQNSILTTNTILSEYEYFFDTNYANKITTSLSGINANEQIISDLNTTTLNVGLHIIHIRFKDNAGKWSSTLSQFFYKLPQTNLTANNITAYRYWFNQDDANIITQNITTPVSYLSLIDNLNLTNLWKGTHSVNFQFKDERGMWSSVLTESVIKNPLPIANFTANKLEVCVGEVVSFTSTSIDGDSHLWNFNNGANSTDSLTVTSYTVSGTYVVSLTVNDIATLKDSTITKTIIVKNKPVATFNYTISNQSVDFVNTTLSANSYVWDFGDGNTATTLNSNHTYINEGGNFIVQLRATNECGTSFINKNILILPNSLVEQNERGSEVIIFPNPSSGKIYIDLVLDKTSQLSVRILDYTAKEIEVLTNENKVEGLHHLWYDATELASGMYFIEVKSNNFYSIKRIVVNH